MQYIYVRTKSVLESANSKIDMDNIDIPRLLDDEAVKVLKDIYRFEDVLKTVTDKNEPYILSRYLIELAKDYSTFYNTHKILTEDENTQNARLFLTYMVNIVLNSGANILGIKMPNRM